MTDPLDVTGLAWLGVRTPHHAAQEQLLEQCWAWCRATVSRG